MPLTRETWQARAASIDDTESIVALINAHARHYYGEDRIGPGEVRSWFKVPGQQQDDTRCWLLREGTLVAFAQVYSPEFPAAWDVLHDVTIHPAHAGDDCLWADVLDWCDRYQWTARKDGATPDKGMCSGTRIHENDLDKRKRYESRGFRHVRNETLMRVELSAVVSDSTDAPEGIKVRRLDMGVDLNGYALAYGEAFRDHWGYADSPCR